MYMSSHKCIVKGKPLASGGTSPDTGAWKVAQISHEVKNVNVVELVNHVFYGVHKASRSSTKGTSCTYVNHGGEYRVIIGKKIEYTTLTYLVEPIALEKKCMHFSTRR